MAGELSKLNTLFKVTFLLIVIGFLPSLVYENYFAKAYVSLVIAFGFLFVLYFNYRKITFSRDEETFIGFGVLVYLVALSGYFQQTPEMTRFAPAMEGYLKALIPLGLIPILHFLKIRNLNFYIAAIALSCIMAFSVNVFGILDSMPRRGGSFHGSPILFGGLAMMFGLLAYVVALYYFKLKNNFLVLTLLFVGTLGVFSSFLSASKGGWIALITVPFLFYMILDTKRQKHIFIGGGLLLFVLIFAFVVFTENTIKIRLLHAWREIDRLIVMGEVSGHSIGYRLQMWNVALQAFLSNPVFGIGVGEFFAFKSNYLLSGEIDQSVYKFKHAHNEYLTILSGMGLVGMAVFLLMFRWLWRFFSKAIKSSVIEKKILGLSGLVVIVCMIDFSLSESFLSSHLGGAAFYFLIALFIYLISQQNETA